MFYELHIFQCMSYLNVVHIKNAVLETHPALLTESVCLDWSSCSCFIGQTKGSFIKLKQTCICMLYTWLKFCLYEHFKTSLQYNRSNRTGNRSNLIYRTTRLNRTFYLTVQRWKCGGNCSSFNANQQVLLNIFSFVNSFLWVLNKLSFKKIKYVLCYGFNSACLHVFLLFYFIILIY